MYLKTVKYGINIQTKSYYICDYMPYTLYLIKTNWKKKNSLQHE